MSDSKEPHPVLTSEFAISQGIEHEPAFHCWVKHVLKKRDKIVAIIRKWQIQYLKKSCKFGVELPKSMEQALALDVKKGKTIWADAISEEIEHVKVSLLDGNKHPLVTSLCNAI